MGDSSDAGGVAGTHGFIVPREAIADRACSSFTETACSRVLDYLTIVLEGNGEEKASAIVRIRAILDGLDFLGKIKAQKQISQGIA